jgi:hypothetical protein
MAILLCSIATAFTVLLLLLYRPFSLSLYTLIAVVAVFAPFCRIAIIMSLGCATHELLPAPTAQGLFIKVGSVLK